MNDGKALIQLAIEHKMANPEKYQMMASCQGCRRKAIEIIDNEDFEQYLINHAHGHPKWIYVVVNRTWYNTYRKEASWTPIYKIAMEPES